MMEEPRMSLKRFQGKTAIVTGGSSGIGKATAFKFAQDGASVAIMARNDRAGRSVVDEINAAGGNASFHQADVGVAGDVTSAMHDIVALYGRVDIAFNNAGTSGGVDAFDAVTETEFDIVLKTNLFGVFHCMRHQIQHFLENDIPGAIVNCSSVSGIVGIPYQSAYCASKHAVVGLTKSVALEYAGAGIRVNAVCPGGIATPMLKRYIRQLPKDKAQLLGFPPVGRGGDPHEVAGLVTWLCSEEATYVVGQAYVIDGGYTAG